MIQIEDKIVSSDLREVKFVCDLKKCLGACCVFGDAGAPLEDEETKILEGIFQRLIPYLRDESVKSIMKQGVHVIDDDGEKVTPLLEGKECAYAFFENGIARCAIEKAHSEGIVDFKKPLSCHLYPVRVKKYSSFKAVNYERWQLCESALKKGRKLNIPIYEFCRRALERAFGRKFCDTLQLAEKHSEKRQE